MYYLVGNHKNDFCLSCYALHGLKVLFCLTQISDPYGMR